MSFPGPRTRHSSISKADLYLPLTAEASAGRPTIAMRRVHNRQRSIDSLALATSRSQSGEDRSSGPDSSSPISLKTSTSGETSDAGSTAEGQLVLHPASPFDTVPEDPIASTSSLLSPAQSPVQTRLRKDSKESPAADHSPQSSRRLMLHGIDPATPAAPAEIASVTTRNTSKLASVTNATDSIPPKLPIWSPSAPQSQLESTSRDLSLTFGAAAPSLQLVTGTPDVPPELSPPYRKIHAGSTPFEAPRAPKAVHEPEPLLPILPSPSTSDSADSQDSHTVKLDNVSEITPSASVAQPNHRNYVRSSGRLVALKSTGPSDRISSAMVRKKSGELVKSSLRSRSSSRINIHDHNEDGYEEDETLTAPSMRSVMSAPQTPTASKMVHFDSQLEHVKLFLAQQRPTAVSRGGSPQETETEEESEGFPFPSVGEVLPGSIKLITADFTPYKMPISAPNFHGDVRLETLTMAKDSRSLCGSIIVRNIAFNKRVVVRFTFDDWSTISEISADYAISLLDNQADRWTFHIKLSDILARIEEKKMQIALRYIVDGRELWDNNGGSNYHVRFAKIAPPAPRVRATSADGGVHSAAPRTRTLARHQWSVTTTGQASERMADLRRELDRLVSDDATSPPALVTARDEKPVHAVAPANPTFSSRYDFGSSLKGTRANRTAENPYFAPREGIIHSPALGSPVRKPMPLTAGAMRPDHLRGTSQPPPPAYMLSPSLGGDRRDMPSPLYDSGEQYGGFWRPSSPVIPLHEATASWDQFKNNISPIGEPIALPGMPSGKPSTRRFDIPREHLLAPGGVTNASRFASVTSPAGSPRRSPAESPAETPPRAASPPPHEDGNRSPVSSTDNSSLSSPSSQNQSPTSPPSSVTTFGGEFSPTKMMAGSTPLPSSDIGDFIEKVRSPCWTLHSF
ncbi:carbohydrate-binding module family 21 protein [Mixia osmundae IAM 14324]|uniref:carbohydrate-binding module family 21 protein n=1 Tax=Mixia osmundae (strain CBS 9802 / IAM 14324 / JCM 22182 / KY 12970) TaxID=764103 RepID=UPI0004A5509B|nr:carbohydrate-binding module family 21 protein [Mixia osmundae IAM 14324]KEI40945.1 carbohydrate-binding module family 21 protein [Mixia osmundae IAM 14324]